METTSRELTDEHVQSIRDAFRTMNEFAQNGGGPGMRGVSPHEVLADVYYVLARGWAETLKELPE